VEKIFKLAMLGWLNRLLGAIFSMMKYVLFVGIAIQLFTSLNQQFGFVDNATLAQSGLYTAIKTISDVVFPYFKELITSKPL
jgi:membrane protein required for colicin V production